MTEARRFPPLWSVKRTVGDHFKVQDANGVDLAYVYGKNVGAFAIGLT
jgi:hypothetical protein